MVVLIYPTLLAVMPRDLLVMASSREAILISPLESVEAWKGFIKVLGCNFFVITAKEPREISGVTEDGLIKEGSVDCFV